MSVRENSPISTDRIMGVVFSGSPRRREVMTSALNYFGIDPVVSMGPFADEDVIKEDVLHLRQTPPFADRYTTLVAMGKLVESLFGLRRELFLHQETQAPFIDGMAKGKDVILFIAGDSTQWVKKGGKFELYERPKNKGEAMQMALSQSDTEIKVDASAAALAILTEKVLPPNLFNGVSERERFLDVISWWRRQWYAFGLRHTNYNVGVDIALRRIPARVGTHTYFCHEPFDENDVLAHWQQPEVDPLKIAGAIDTSSFGHLSSRMPVHMIVINRDTHNQFPSLTDPAQYTNSHTGLAAVFSSQQLAMEQLVLTALEKLRSPRGVFERDEELRVPLVDRMLFNRAFYGLSVREWNFYYT